jgi:hypothetical protein
VCIARREREGALVPFTRLREIEVYLQTYANARCA